MAPLIRREHTDLANLVTVFGVFVTGGGGLAKGTVLGTLFGCWYVIRFFFASRLSLSGFHRTHE